MEWVAGRFALRPNGAGVWCVMAVEGSFRGEGIAVTIKVSSTRLPGHIEEIAAKEVIRGRYHQDRRQAGTKEAEADGTEKGSAEGQAHRAAGLQQEETEEVGAWPVEALDAGAEARNRPPDTARVVQVR